MDNLLLKQHKAYLASIVLARAALETYWYYAQGRVGSDQINFKAIFDEYGKMLFFIDLLRLVRYSGDDKEFHVDHVKEAMGIRALHDTLYEEKEDELTAHAKNVCEDNISYFESIGEDPDFLKIKLRDLDTDDCLPHPLIRLLQDRDSIAWILIGLCLLQEDGQYTSIDINQYEQRIKISDETFKKMVFECVNDYYTEYSDKTPFAPDDFWWRHIAGHEYADR